VAVASPTPLETFSAASLVARVRDQRAAFLLIGGFSYVGHSAFWFRRADRLAMPIPERMP
jgi:hypothetical protein